MKNKLFAFTLVLLIVINVSALASLAYNRWLRPMPKDAGFRAADSKTPFEKELCLSGTQQDCLHDLIVSFNAEISNIRYQMQEKKKALIQEMKKETPDMASIDKLIEEINRLQAEVQKKAVLNIFQEKKILTPEQKERFFRMLENHVCPREHGQDSATDKHQDCLNSH
jgi:Spy/CpxP family protein refolding chaperone